MMVYAMFCIFFVVASSASRDVGRPWCGQVTKPWSVRPRSSASIAGGTQGSSSMRISTSQCAQSLKYTVDSHVGLSGVRLAESFTVLLPEIKASRMRGRGQYLMGVYRGPLYVKTPKPRVDLNGGCRCWGSLEEGVPINHIVHQVQLSFRNAEAPASFLDAAQLFEKV